MEGKRRPMSAMASLRGPEPQAVGGLEVRSSPVPAKKLGNNSILIFLKFEIL
mgnify:CR=1 FL=1